MSFKYDGESDENNKIKPGFQLGVVAEYEISDVFVIQPGILIAQQGCKIEESGEESGYKWDYKAKYNVTYLQIPVNAQYKLDLGGNTLLLQAGPYFGFAVGGKIKVEGSSGGESIDEEVKIKFGGDEENDDMKGGDFGLGLGAGLQFGNIQVGAGYNLGLANLSNSRDAKFKQKNNGIAITLTYFFGK